MSSPSTAEAEPWQKAWDDAQPRISQIWDSMASMTSPIPRPIRVGQLDAELLDQELVHLLQEPLRSALSIINSSLRARFESELDLVIRLALYKLSMWNTGASYGAKLQDLRYTATHSFGNSLSPSGLPKKLLFIHGTMTIIMPYFHSKIRAFALSHAWPDAPSSDGRRKAWEFLTSAETLYTFLGLLNFVAFLWDGRYRAIADRLLGMRLGLTSRLVKRDVSYEFMNRQMVWHAFTEFLLFLLPLVSARSIRRRLARLGSLLSFKKLASLLPAPAAHSLGISSHRSASLPPPKPRGKYWSMATDQCAICAENASFNLNLAEPANAFSSLAANASSGPSAPSPDSDSDPPAFPIYIPYRASCGDVYCYHCIAERLMRAEEESEGQDDRWDCLRCGEVVHGAERLTVVFEMDPESDYEFSSDMDFTDASASMGSYSMSGMSDE